MTPILKITVSTCTLSNEALSGLSYHPEAIVRLAAWQEINRRRPSARVNHG